MTRGIDYGMGQANIDTETGIRYGILSCHDLMPEALEDVYSNGDDLDFEEHKAQVLADLTAAIAGVLDDAGHAPRFNDPATMAQEIVDNLEWDGYQNDGCTRYRYEADGYSILLDSSGDAWAIKSPFYTRATFCSPCAPGACSITSPCDDGEKAYCFGHDWFEDGKAPYPVYRVSDDSVVDPV